MRMQIVNSLKYSSSNLTRACYFIRNCVWIPVWSYLFFVTIFLVSLNLQVPRRKLSNKSIFIHTAPFNYYEFWLNHTIYRTLLFPKYGIFKKNLWTCHFYKEVWSVIIERMHVCMQAYFWRKFIQREKDASKSQKPGVVLLRSPKHL